MVVCSRCIPVLEIINLQSNTAQLLVRANVSTALTLACTSYQCKLGTRAEDLRCSRDQCLCNNGDTAGQEHTTQKLIAQCHKSKGQCDLRAHRRKSFVFLVDSQVQDCSASQTASCVPEKALALCELFYLTGGMFWSKLHAKK